MVSFKEFVWSILLLSTFVLRFGSGALTQSQLAKLCEGYNLQAISHPEGTAKFIFCSDKGNTENACPPGTCFNLQQSACVKSSESCKVTSSATSEVSHSDCLAEDFLMKKIPSKDCQKYYVCTAYDIDPMEVKCPLYQHYSKFKQQCVSPAEAYCLPPELWCKNLPNGARLAANECFQYYECSNGESILRSCSHYQYFDGSDCVRGSCTHKDGVITVRKPNCQGQEDAFLPHSKCNMYYVCHNDMAWEVQCPNGNFYDEVYKRCVKDVKNACDA